MNVFLFVFPLVRDEGTGYLFFSFTTLLPLSFVELVLSFAFLLFWLGGQEGRRRLGYPSLALRSLGQDRL